MVKITNLHYHDFGKHGKEDTRSSLTRNLLVLACAGAESGEGLWRSTIARTGSLALFPEPMELHTGAVHNAIESLQDASTATMPRYLDFETA